MNKRVKNPELLKTSPISTTRISNVGLTVGIIIYLAAVLGAILMSRSNLSDITILLPAITRGTM
jgi:hypothetical protein